MPPSRGTAVTWSALESAVAARRRREPRRLGESATRAAPLAPPSFVYSALLLFALPTFHGENNSQLKRRKIVIGQNEVEVAFAIT
jgi:hypothetical protein